MLKNFCRYSTQNLTFLIGSSLESLLMKTKKIFFESFIFLIKLGEGEKNIEKLSFLMKKQNLKTKYNFHLV